MTRAIKHLTVIGIALIISISLVSCFVIPKPDSLSGVDSAAQKSDNIADAEKFIVGEWETDLGYFVINTDKTFRAYYGDSAEPSSLMLSGTYICLPIFIAGSGFSDNVEETGVELKFDADDMYDRDGVKVSDEELVRSVSSNLLFWVFPVDVFNKRYERELTKPAEGPYVFDYRYDGYMNAKKVK